MDVQDAWLMYSETSLPALVLLALVGICCSDAAHPQARVVEEIPSYGVELRARAARPWDESPSDADAAASGYSGPGRYARAAPNGTFVAVTLSPVGGPIGDLFGLFMEWPHIHTVAVWRPDTSGLAVVTPIMEADPGSGIAHRYSWSADSKALLIYGWGRLPDDYSLAVDLCLVYLPATNELLRLRRCGS